MVCGCIAGIHMMSMLVPILISFLLEPDKVGSASKPSHALHEYGLQRLMTIGPQYPAHFRNVMQASPELKSRLEAAVKAEQINAKTQTKQENQKLSGPSQPAKPSIKLKTDFSNFTG